MVLDTITSWSLSSARPGRGPRCVSGCVPLLRHPTFDFTSRLVFWCAVPWRRRFTASGRPPCLIKKYSDGTLDLLSGEEKVVLKSRLLAVKGPDDSRICVSLKGSRCMRQQGRRVRRPSRVYQRQPDTDKRVLVLESLHVTTSGSEGAQSKILLAPKW